MHDMRIAKEHPMLVHADFPHDIEAVVTFNCFGQAYAALARLLSRG
jgi:hypothetical protein